MRIYEGAPRRNYEEVLRSIGALLDQRGMREIVAVGDDLVRGGVLVEVVAAPGEDYPGHLFSFSPRMTAARRLGRPN